MADFEARDAHVTGVPVADTAMLMEALADRRGIAARPRSAPHPSARGAVARLEEGRPGGRRPAHSGHRWRGSRNASRALPRWMPWARAPSWEDEHHPPRQAAHAAPAPGSSTVSTTAATTPRPKTSSATSSPRVLAGSAKASEQRPTRKRMPTSSSERIRVSRSLQATSRGG